VKQLAPDLFERRFSDLVEIGRARLPALAPEWTDHNAHDPGITLMELLAWVAEAEMYSLARRPRRDERLAYEALLGIAPSGTRPARGLIWPDHGDPQSPAATYKRNVVIGKDAIVNVLTDEKPPFHPTHTLLFVPGRVQRLEARLRGGRIVDYTATNERGGPAFLPFGESAGRTDVLAMTFRCRDDAGLFGARRQEAKGALWPIGVRTDASGIAEQHTCGATITATLVADGQRFPLRIVSDSTSGLLATGVLLLDLERVAGSPREFTVELRSPRGFARPPRFLRIEPNVLPIEQGRFIAGEVQTPTATGLPDWTFTLGVPGLQFAAGDEPLAIEIEEASGLEPWKRCGRLSDRGPDERVFELDTAKGSVLFGNGVNGRVPPAGGHVLASYGVSAGEEGDVARNRRWRVTGVDGAYGVNLDPIAGGAAPPGPIDRRREARRRARDEHALVSAQDIVAAAKALPLLDVVRAWVLPAAGNAPRTGVVTLVAMRARPNGNEPARIPETPRWRESVRRRLAPRMPLGTRLVVAAPRYAGIVIAATVSAASGRDPQMVKAAIERALKTRLTLLEWKPGVAVTRRDVAAWLRSVEGVDNVAALRLNGSDEGEVAVPRGGLPRLDLARSAIDVRRSTS